MTRRRDLVRALGAVLISSNDSLFEWARLFGRTLGFSALPVTGAGADDHQQPRSLPSGSTLKSIKDFGAKGDGISNDDHARALAELASDSIYWPDGTYNLNTSPDIGKSWGPGKCFISGVRTYLRPSPEPPEGIYAEIFGLPGPSDLQTDAGAILNRAIVFAQSNNLPLILPRNGTYVLRTGLVAYQGRSTSDRLSYSVLISGRSCRLCPFPGVTALSIEPRCPTAEAPSGRAIGHIDISDIIFDNYFGDQRSAALKIGAAGKRADNFRWSRITNLLTIGFSSEATISMSGSRHIVWDRLAIRGGTVHISEEEDGAFCGDMVFDNCEFSGSTTVPPLHIRSQGSGAPSSKPAEVRGVHFTDCDFYGSGTLIEVGAGAHTGDIWFTSCAWDGPSAAPGESAIVFKQRGSTQSEGQMFQIHIMDPYIVGHHAAAITIEGGGFGKIDMFEVSGAKIDMLTLGNQESRSTVIAAHGTSGLTITRLRCSAIRGSNSDIILCDSCDNLIVSDVAVTDSTGLNSIVQITGSSNDFIIDRIIGPVASGAVVRDESSGKRKSIGQSVSTML